MFRTGHFPSISTKESAKVRKDFRKIQYSTLIGVRRVKRRKNYPEAFELLEKHERAPIALALERQEMRADYELRKTFCAALDAGQWRDNNPFATGDWRASAKLGTADPNFGFVIRLAHHDPHFNL